MVHQHVHEVFEEARLAGAEEASCYLVHCLLQLGDTVIVGHGVVAEDRKTEMLAVLHRTEQTVDGSYSCGFHGRALKSTTSQVENTFRFYYYVMILFSCRYMVKLL